MKEIKFVDIGEGITEGHVQKWLVADGSDVKEDSAVLQVETDKAVVNIPAPLSGRIKEVVKEGDDVKVGDTLAFVGTPEELANISQNAAQHQEKPKPASVAAKENAAQAKQPAAAEEVLAPPSVRKLAEELKVDLKSVKGTGPHGRITQDDVKRVAAGSRQAPQVQQNAQQQAQQSSNIERVPLSQTRKAIARNMEASWTIPRASHMDLINAEELYNILQKEKNEALKELGVKLSYLPFIIKATVQALKENPKFNASYDKDRQEVLVKKYYNIGLAAEAPDGLKVIVIRDSDKKSIIQIAKDIDELHKKVLDQTISISEMRDTSFTITNVGSLGGGFLAIPMINYPDVAILGVTMVRDMPIVEDGVVKPGRILPFTVTFDHRVVDGAEAVKFGNAIKKYLEDPDFLEML